MFVRRRLMILLALLGLIGLGRVTVPAQTGQVRIPPTALCRDGYYSFSQNCSGTCSWHGGVKVWYTRRCGQGRGAAPQGVPPANVFGVVNTYQAPIAKKAA